MGGLVKQVADALQRHQTIYGPDYEGMARAAVIATLEGIREPSEAQYDALSATDKMWREQTSETVWKTYIDALLNQIGEGPS